MSISTSALNLPSVITAVSYHSDRYEKALIEGDFNLIKTFFWDSDLAIRFGVMEELYGIDAIKEFQNNRPFKLTERKVLKKDIVSFADHLAIVTLEFTLPIQNDIRHGRQTQVWLKMNDNWKVVSAHVSHRMSPPTAQSIEQSPEQSKGVTEAVAAKNSQATLENHADLVHLSIPEGYQSNVQSLFDNTKRIVAPLIDFELPDDCEPAPVYQP